MVRPTALSTCDPTPTEELLTIRISDYNTRILTILPQVSGPNSSAVTLCRQ
jgi:hypothetical protein